MHTWEGHADGLAAAADAAAQLFADLDEQHHAHAVTVHGDRHAPWADIEPEAGESASAVDTPTGRRNR